MNCSNVFKQNLHKAKKGQQFPKKHTHPKLELLLYSSFLTRNEVLLLNRKIFQSAFKLFQFHQFNTHLYIFSIL